MNKKITNLLRRQDNAPAKLALCLSGTGSNAEKLLEFSRSAECKFKIAVLFTDAPDRSATFRLGERFNVPVEHLDIIDFYSRNGESSTRLDSERRWQLRREWSEKVWKKLIAYEIDFAVFAGFVPLNSLPEKLPCLNVHPGDLTVEENGVRRYAGLHYKPVERALLDGNTCLRSSVILVQPLTADGECVIDGGPVLGISQAVPVNLDGHTVAELNSIHAGRTKAPFDDELRKIAVNNIENLKRNGDHTVLPPTVNAFASGRFGMDDHGKLYFLSADNKWIEVQTVEFFPDGKENPKQSTVPEKIKRSGKSIVRFAKYLYTKIVRGKGSPDYIARGWSLGMFVGCVIPVFCQLIIAIPLSFVVRGSKIGAALGTFITTPPTAIFIYPVQIYIGNRIIGGNLSFAMIKDSAMKMLHGGDWKAFADMGGELIAAFFAGGLLFAAVMTPITYFLVRFLVVRYRNLREAAQKRKKVDLHD